MDHKRYRFGEFEFDPASGELTRVVAPGSGSSTRLAPQPARLLELLAEARGEVVTREAIRAEVWRDVKVEFDASLHFCVRQVRTALGDSATESRYIETLPRRGYRLLPEVETLAPAPPLSPEPAVAPTPAAGSGRSGRRVLTIAVLLLLSVAAALWISTMSRPGAKLAPAPLAVGVMPFSPPEGWGVTPPTPLTMIADGMLEALVEADRADGVSLRVVGPSNTIAYDRPGAALSELAEAFDLDYIVNGRFGSDDDGPRLLAELIRTSDGAHIWVRRYLEFKDVDAITREVTREVLARLPRENAPPAE